MTELQNDRFLRALLREPVDRTPVWIMRQAGRYLPEYRATRKRAGSFLDLCKNPELACEVTLQPLERFELDAAILFSDILTIPDAMGLGLYFTEGEGPAFENPVRCKADVDRIGIPDPEAELSYVPAAVRTIRQALNGRVPLIGFSGSPWTLATYMIEGRGSKNFAKAKGMLYGEPALLHQLLDKLAQSVTSYLNAQIAAGAQAAMIFDTWGGMLTEPHYKEFSLGYMQQIVDGLTREADGRRVPVILFTKGGGLWLDAMADTGCDALGLDWTQPISRARALVGDRVALQGNLDPCALYASPEQVQAEARRIIEDYGHGSGHVFNLGHGVTPDIDPDNVKALVDTVHEYSAAFHTDS
jgi:uroporphyrinogen decarboxylase